VRAFRGHTDCIGALVWQGSRFFSAGDDGRILCWDAGAPAATAAVAPASGDEETPGTGPLQELLGHRSAVLRQAAPYVKIHIILHVA